MEEQQSLPTECWLRPADVRQLRPTSLSQRGGAMGLGKLYGSWNSSVFLVTNRLFGSIKY